MRGPGQMITKEELRKEIERIKTFDVRSYFRPDNYSSYIVSDQWRSIRKRVLSRDKSTCFRCGGRATVAHHRRYTQAVLDGEDDTQLVSLCEDCHRTVHNAANGKPRDSWNEGEAILIERPPSLTPITTKAAVDAYHAQWKRPHYKKPRSRARGPQPLGIVPRRIS